MKIWNTDNMKCWWGLWSKSNSQSLLLGMQSGPATMEDSLVVSYLTKPNIFLRCMIQQLCTLVITQGSWKLCPPKNLHMICSICIRNCQSLEQPKFPLVREWINWYIKIMQYYSVFKRNELSSHEKTWRNLKCIIPLKEP